MIVNPSVGHKNCKHIYPNNSKEKIKQKMTEVEGEIDNSVITGDFYIPLSKW